MEYITSVVNSRLLTSCHDGYSLLHLLLVFLTLVFLDGLGQKRWGLCINCTESSKSFISNKTYLVAIWVLQNNYLDSCLARSVQLDEGCVNLRKYSCMLNNSPDMIDCGKQSTL
jgi:hypothetical protein